MTNAPDRPHWTINSCFGAFHIILVHLGPLTCLTKLGAKCSELVQKFVRWSRVESFRNERTRSTPLDPKLMFWCISYYLGAFPTVSSPYEIRFKTGILMQNFVPQSRVRIFHNECTRANPLDPKLMFWRISYCFDGFQMVSWPYKTWFKTGTLMKKFVPQSHVGIFRHERIQSTPLDHKLMFACVA